MKKYKLVLLAVISAFMILPGCQDMDLSPKDELPDNLFWKSSADYMKAANQLYNSTETFDKRKDVDSDIAFELNENTTSNSTYIAENEDKDFWNIPYKEIRRTNMIVEKSKSYEGNFSEIERYVAEARFFRAYYHWLLMKKYNDVPIITIPLYQESKELYGPRDKQKEVEDFILSELEKIYSKLPLQSELKSDEIGRITQGAVLALKARVALFAGTWAKYHQHRSDHQQLFDQAIQAAERVIESKQYSLFEGEGNESYRQLFIDKGDDSPEDIFVSRYYIDIRMHSTAHSIYWGWRGTPTKKMADMYLCKTTGLPINHPNSGFQGYEKMTDEFKDRDPRMNQTILMPGTTFLNAQTGQEVCAPQFTTRPETRTGYKLWKFMGEILSGTNNSAYNFRIIRYPEVLLILTEAIFEKEGSVSNDILNKTINVIRSRKGVEMPPLTNEFIQTNGLDMQTELRRERTVELAFEGFRREDLRRWKTAETELKQAIKGIKYKGTEYEAQDVLNSGNPGLVDTDGFLIVEPAGNRIFTAPKNYYYSLPLDELYLNPGLFPNNPGWE